MRFIILLLLGPFTICAQTKLSIGPVAEVVRLNSNYETPSNAEIEIHENMKHIWYGAQVDIKKSISKGFFLATSLQLTRVQPQVFVIGFAGGGIDRILIDYYKIRVAANYKWKEWFHIGIGGNCNLLTNLRYSYRHIPGATDVLTDWQREYGITGIAGTHWRRFGLDFNYFHAFTQTNDEEADFNFYPIRSLSCVLYYEFDLSKKKKRRR